METELNRDQRGADVLLTCRANGVIVIRMEERCDCSHSGVTFIIKVQFKPQNEQICLFGTYTFKQWHHQEACLSGFSLGFFSCCLSFLFLTTVFSSLLSLSLTFVSNEGLKRKESGSHETHGIQYRSGLTPPG